jgi:succinate dehydrogenase / fumarate reductase, cytochrome b subunit
VSASALSPLSRLDLARRRRGRLYTLSGAVPLAGFLLVHLVVQASALGGWQSHRRLSETFDAIPLAIGLEIACVYIPLLAHLVLGVLRSDSGHAARERAELPKRILHRVGAVSLGVFIVFHVWQFRWRLWTGEIDRTDLFPELVASLSSTVSGGIPVTAVAYLVGIAAAAAHGARCVYAACCEWQLVPPAKQLALGRACAALGIMAFLVGAAVVIDLATGAIVPRFPG